MEHCWCEGRRMVIATVPAVVAGGSTICTRSPPGNPADSKGEEASIRWPVEFATSLANLRHQSKLRSGSSSRRQPELVSMKASPGRFTHSSVTSGSSRKRCIARSVSASAEFCGHAALRTGRTACSAARKPALSLAAGMPKLIHTGEIDIARDQNLNAIAVVLANRGRNAQGVLEDFGRDILRRRRVVDHRAGAPVRRLHGRLHSRVDGADEQCRTKALPEMTLDGSGKACAPQLIGARGIQRYDHTRRCARLGPQHK